MGPSYGLEVLEKGKNSLFLMDLHSYTQYLDQNFTTTVGTEWDFDEDLTDDMKVYFMMDLEKYPEYFR